MKQPVAIRHNTIEDSKNRIIHNKINDKYYSLNLKNEKMELIKTTGFSNKGQTTIPYYIIKPLSTKKMFWNILVGFIVLIQCFLIPIEVAFGAKCVFPTEIQNALFLFKIVALNFYFIDILLTFFTALENEKGEYEYEIKQIALTYIKKNFILDLLSSFPYEIILPHYYCFDPEFSLKDFLQYLRFLRIIKIIHISDLIEKYTSANLISLVRLFKIIFFYYNYIHIVGLTFVGNSAYFIDMLPQHIKDNRSSSNFFELYCYSIFVGIFLVLGNDVTYRTNQAKIMVIIINIVSLIVNANIFGYIAVTLKMTFESEESLEKIDNINDFLNYQDIDTELKNDIKRFYLLMYKRQRDLYFNTNIFGDISNCLKSNAKYQQWKKSYFDFDTLFVSHSSEFLTDCLLVMKAKIVLPNERILHEGESTTDFYLMTDGAKCAVMIHGVRIKILKQGEFFGETAIFLSSEKRTASVDSLNLSDILYITGVDFLFILRNHQEEADYLKSIAMSNFYNTIAMTRTNLATHLFPKNTKDPLFKSNLYKSIYENRDSENMISMNNKVETNGNKKNIKVDNLVSQLKSKVVKDLMKD